MRKPRLKTGKKSVNAAFMELVLTDMIGDELAKKAKKRRLDGNSEGGKKSKEDFENKSPHTCGESSLQNKKRENETNRQMEEITGISHNTISKYNKIVSIDDERSHVNVK